ncbi:MAG: Wzy polymerase domain-containing protein [Polaromonas sp.]
MFRLVSMFSACVLGLSWLLSSHFPPWMSWHSEALAFLAAFLLAWVGVARVLRAASPRAITLPFAALPLIGLALVAAIQLGAGLLPFWGDVWVLWFYMALCVTCLTLGFASVSPPAQPPAATNSPAPTTVLAFALLIGALASAVIASAQVFSPWEPSEWIVGMQQLRRPGGNLAQPNHLATLLVMGIASLVFLYQSKTLGGISSGLMLFLLCAGIAVTESRTGALSFLALLGWWLLKRRAIGDTPPVWAGVGCGIGFIGMFLAWPKMLNALLLSEQAAVNTTSSLRLEVWAQLLEAVARRPWWGWGIHQVAAAHNAVADGYAVSSPFSYSHNLVLDLAIWVGVPLTLLLVGVASVWLWRRTRDANQLLPWYGLAVALPLGLHSMLEYPFAYAYFLAPVMFLLGAVEAAAGVKPLARINAKSVGAILLVTTVVLAWSVVEYLEVEEDFRVARFAALRIGYPPPEHHLPKVILFDQLGVLLDDTRFTPTPDMSTEAMELVKNAALHYPWSATQYRYALALALNGNMPEAARQIQVIRRLWGEKQYEGVKRQIDELATKYPELRKLSLP